MSTAKFVKQAVPFGISHMLVGAIMVHNFRIRTKMHSVLDQELQSETKELAGAIYRGEISHSRRLGKNGCVIHDFSTVRIHKFQIIKDKVMYAMLQADVSALNTKYAGTPHYVSINKLPTQDEYQPTKADCWDGEGAEL